MALYQATELFVFPSIYEGYGLPVAEALACGAPVIGSGTSSVAELLDEDARFDPTDVDDIAAAIERTLIDDAFLQTLRKRATRQSTWDDVARRTVPVYESLLSRPARAARRRPVTAMVTPLPPARSEVGRYSSQLAEQLLAYTDVELLVDGMHYTNVPPVAPANPTPTAAATGTAGSRKTAYRSDAAYSRRPRDG